MRTEYAIALIVPGLWPRCLGSRQPSYRERKQRRIQFVRRERLERRRRLSKQRWRHDRPPSDLDVADATTLTMTSFPVAAGQEAFMCQDFANPFQGQQVDIKSYELHMTQDSHHMIAFYKVGASDGEVVPCPQSPASSHNTPAFSF